MDFQSLLRRRVLIPTGVALVLLVVLCVWLLWPTTPQPGSARHEEFCEAFWAGAAALEVGLVPIAEEELTKAISLINYEPAALANRGLLYARTERPDLAEKDLQQAASLAPNNPDIKELLAYLRETQNRLPEAIALQRQATDAAPDARRLYRLQELLSRDFDEAPGQERLSLLARIVELRPGNLFALTQWLNLAMNTGDHDAARKALAALERVSSNWSPGTRKALAEAKAKAGRPGFRPAALMLQNALRSEPGFTLSSAELNAGGAFVGTPLVSFLKVPNVETLPAPPDTELTYPWADQHFVPGIEGRAWPVVLVAWLGRQTGPSIWAANAEEVRRADGPSPSFPFPCGPRKVAPSANGVLFADLENEGNTGLVLAGAGGLRFWMRQADGGWKETTAATKLPKDVLEGDHFGAWAVDYDLDGDLDIVLAPRARPPVVLRNNMDSTYTVMKPFAGVPSVRGLAWVDLDEDGVPDACFLDGEGKLHAFTNLRGGQFRRMKLPSPDERIVALTAGCPHGAGRFRLILLGASGRVYAVGDQLEELAKLDEPMEGQPGEVMVALADVDNNAAFDIVARSRDRTAILLGDGKGGYQAGEVPRNSQGRSVGGLCPPVDIDGDGWLDLVGTYGAGAPYVARGKGTRDYRWIQLRPLASLAPDARGDKRVNTFNLGGEAETRTGRLVLKQPITQPVTHFGLGTNPRAHLTRIVWTNGAAQWKFGRPASAYLYGEQRLKGSCPFLFAHDGQRMEFVTDFLWSSPLGMYINGQDKGGFLQTSDWVKVRSDQLRPRGGLYDLRVNANLWETHYIDQLALLAVDHPAGTECHVDERFFLTPTKPQVYLSERSRPVAKAWDHKGNDVTAIVRERDAKHLDRAGRGTWQGVTNDHWVECDLGDDAPKSGPVYLLATGWLHPTDSSVNFALAHSSRRKPVPLTLEVPDDSGGWRAIMPPLGFPAGKNKTLVIRLDGIEGEGKVSRRFRLRTNLEIYWDRLAWAKGLDAKQTKSTTVLMRSAELRYRGIVEMTQADASSPELPHYDRIVHIGPKWRDLVGHHTRFGDVRELLQGVDGRYVIMNAGDEIRLTFPEVPVPKGMERTFVWVADGWVKDGDLNTRWGGTVLPLPYHGMKDYSTMPGRLDYDPVYRRFPKDWETYHTRFVAPGAFRRGLRPYRAGGRGE
jgi:hypothetical protein